MAGDPRYSSAAPVHRLVRRAAATSAGSRLLAAAAHRVDGVVLRATRGRRTLTSLVAGLPVVVLGTTGARTGQQRRTVLLAVPTAQGLAVLASAYGSTRHPAWFHNLRADPRATASTDGAEHAVLAEVLSGDRREQVWEKAVSLYPGWRAYATRTAGREIPVVLLHPVPEPG